MVMGSLKGRLGRKIASASGFMPAYMPMGIQAMSVMLLRTADQDCAPLHRVSPAYRSMLSVPLESCSTFSIHFLMPLFVLKEFSGFCRENLSVVGPA